MNNYTVRIMTPAEAEWALQLAAGEGWNPGLFDAGCFYRTDPQGFFIGLLDGKPVGCISAVSYEGKFGFVGLYIVIPEYRGQGYGIKLWQAALAHLRGHNIGLDGVPAQVLNYIKSGFHPAYSNFRFRGIFPLLPEVSSEGIVNISEVPFELIRQYDRRCFPSGRTGFLRNWLKLPQSTAIGYFEADLLKGYGVIRKCRQGYKIGPLFADDSTYAEVLFQTLVSKIAKDSPVYLDVPEANSEAISLALKYNLKKVFATARMYTGNNPEIAINRVFGVTTFELG